MYFVFGLIILGALYNLSFLVPVTGSAAVVDSITVLVLVIAIASAAILDALEDLPDNK